jgi:DNA-binding Xre family transcriptional regulator
MVMKGAKEGRRIFYKDISRATGISISTLSRIAVDPQYNINRAHIEKLCDFFDVGLEDLISIVQDNQIVSKGESVKDLPKDFFSDNTRSYSSGRSNEYTLMEKNRKSYQAKGKNNKK